MLSCKNKDLMGITRLLYMLDLVNWNDPIKTIQSGNILYFKLPGTLL